MDAAPRRGDGYGGGGRGRNLALLASHEHALTVAVAMTSPTPATTVTAVGRRGAPRSMRRLYHAEQLMEERKLPKKKYLATQRLRRDLERSSVESLKLDVNFLRQEIVNLRTVREIVQAQRLTTQVSAVSGLMGMVAQYYSTVKHGIGGETPASRLSARDKIAFLRSVMDENLHFGANTRGIDKFIQQCVGYTLFHARLCVESPRMRELQSSDAFPVIVSTNLLRVRVARKTLETMFPHTLADEVLVQELIGQELLYPCETRFYFNSDGKIVRHDAELDFVAGLNAALQSLRKVTEIMDHARLDGAVILMEDGEIDLERVIEENTRLDEMKAAAVTGSGDGGSGSDGADVSNNNLEVHEEEESDGNEDEEDGDVPVVLPNPVVNRMSIDMLLS